MSCSFASPALLERAFSRVAAHCGWTKFIVNPIWFVFKILSPAHCAADDQRVIDEDLNKVADTNIQFTAAQDDTVTARAAGKPWVDYVEVSGLNRG